MPLGLAINLGLCMSCKPFYQGSVGLQFMLSNMLYVVPMYGWGQGGDLCTPLQTD